MHTPRGIFTEREFNFGAILFAFVIAVVVFGPTELSAQWKPLYVFKDGIEHHRVISVTFLDAQGAPEIGFAGVLDDVNKQGQLWRTTDRGFTWSKIGIFPERILNQVSFKNRDTAWMAASNFETDAIGACYKTTDGGLTWSRLFGTEGGYCSSVYYHKPTDRVILTRWYQPSLVSSDGGSSWEEFGCGCETGVTFLDDSLGIVGATGLGFGLCDNTPYYLTTNGGKTWYVGPNSLGDNWGMLAIREKGTYLAIGHRYKLFASTDSGRSWEVRSKIEMSAHEDGISGEVVTTNCLIAVQSVELGFSLSTDQGYTWHHVGGPGQEFGSRMFVAGNTIFASTGSHLFVNEHSGYTPKHLDLHVDDTVDASYFVRISYPTYIPNPTLMIDSIVFTLEYDQAAATIIDELPYPAYRIHNKEELAPGKTRYTIWYRGGFPRIDTNILTMRVRPNITPSGTSVSISISDVYLDSLSNFYIDCMGPVESPTQTVELSVDGCAERFIRDHMRDERALTIKSINPNPTIGSITIEYESKLDGAVTLTVYSLSGVLVHEEVIAGKAVQLDASGWASGAYTIVLKSGEEEARGTVIKN